MSNSDNKFNLELKVLEARKALERCNRDYDKELQDLESKHTGEVSMLKVSLAFAERELRWETHVHEMIEEAQKKTIAEIIEFVKRIHGG